MAETKTKSTGASVEAFLDRVEPAGRREDARQADALLRRVSGEEPYMWGSSIVGYGSYHYKYDSGHEGDAPRLGFSPRKSALTLYVLTGCQGENALLARLGKHKTGKSCLYINKLADVDMDTLEELACASLDHMDERYPRA